MQAIISDIHGNLEAVTAVIEDIESLNISEIICLGDIVGYGPEPGECIDIVMDRCEIALKGNHDEAVVMGAFGFNPIAREAVEWTRDQLQPKWYSSGKKKRRWKFIRDLPLIHKEGKITYVHGSPKDPTMEYILKSDTKSFLGTVSNKITEVFNLVEGPCFVGHTHEPGIINEEGEFLEIKNIEYSYQIAEDERKVIVNVGSVGQPRDGDNRACYITFDENKIEYRRVEYDIEKTYEKIKAIEDLDVRIGERLKLGK